MWPAARTGTSTSASMVCTPLRAFPSLMCCPYGPSSALGTSHRTITSAACPVPSFAACLSTLSAPTLHNHRTLSLSAASPSGTGSPSTVLLLFYPEKKKWRHKFELQLDHPLSH